MGKAVAHTPYITFVGPRSKSIMVGWEAQKKYWADANKRFSARAISLSDQHIHVNGNLAWEMGQETGEIKLKNGSARQADYIVTNVYEKIGGRWLMVSHHHRRRDRRKVGFARIPSLSSALLRSPTPCLTAYTH